MSRRRADVRRTGATLFTAAALFVAGTIGVRAQTPAVPPGSIVGVVRAHDETTLQSENGGIVERILVNEGDRVKEGQPLVQLKNDRETIAVDLARAELTKAVAEQQETTVLLDSAKRELERVQLAGDALPRKELEDHEDAVERLTATLSANTAERARAEQELRMREEELKETQLVAPFAGAVTQLRVHRGDTLRPMDTPVLDLVDLHALYVEVLVPGSAARGLRLGAPARVQVEADWIGRTGQLTGTISYINPTVDAASRTVKVKVTVGDANGSVRPGMIANVRFDEAAPAP